MDLGVRYIHRSPEIDYSLHSANPEVEGWPEVGQQVSWEAVVKNWTSEDRKSIWYEWRVDDQTVDQGMVDLPAGSEVTVVFPWAWTFDRHELTFAIDTNEDVAEISESNNELMVYTDAITIGFYVEQSFYDYFHAHQHKLGIGSNSFDDWAQRHVAIWNEMLRDAVFPETPDGVLDRVRLDRITVVGDAELPLADEVKLDNVTFRNPAPATSPNGDDRTVDMQWGFPSQQLQSSHPSIQRAG